MTSVRITKMQREDAGHVTARVTADGADAVRVDNTLGSWTFTVDQSADSGSRSVPRRDVVPWVAAKLQARLRAFLRQEPVDDTETHSCPEANGRPLDTRAIAERMAKAGAAAVPGR